MTKIAVALSGGVDSSLTVHLLRDAGYDVIGITLRVQHESGGASVCAGDSAVEKARRVADYLGVKHYVCDVCDFFADNILKYAWDEYSDARTPCPCVRCNEKIKFGKLLDYARELGCEKLATGHYAQITDYNGIKRIARGVDRRKDQSYFLSGLKNDVTRDILFPLGTFEKPRVRELAAKYGIPSAKAPDSQNVCITQPGRTFAETLSDLYHDTLPAGHFTMQGRILAPHNGIHHYTIGQRHGLGSLVPTKCAFVKAIHSPDVEITTELSDLDAHTVTASDAVWHVDTLPERLSAQIRYRSPAAACTVERNGTDVTVRFPETVHAAAPGQIIAFYDGDIVVGRAVIQSSDAL